MKTELIGQYLDFINQSCRQKPMEKSEIVQEEKLADIRKGMRQAFSRGESAVGICWWEAEEKRVEEAVGRRFFPDYLEDKKWSLSFALRLQEEGNKCSVFLVEHGQKREMNSFHDTEFRKISRYSEEEQKTLMEKREKELNKIDTYGLLLGNQPVTDLSGLKTYGSYSDYMLSADHWMDRNYLMSSYEHTLYKGRTDHYYNVSNESIRYDILYALGNFQLCDGYLSRLILEDTPVPVARSGEYELAPGPKQEERLAYYMPETDWKLCVAEWLTALEEVNTISPCFLPAKVMEPGFSPEEAARLSALLAILAPKLDYSYFMTGKTFVLPRETVLKDGTESVLKAAKAIELVSEWERTGGQNAQLTQMILEKYRKLKEKTTSHGVDEEELIQLGVLAHGLGQFYRLSEKFDEAEELLQVDYGIWTSVEPDDFSIHMSVEAGARYANTLFYRQKYRMSLLIAKQELLKIDRYIEASAEGSVWSTQTELMTVKGCCEMLLANRENGMFHIRLANEYFERLFTSEDCATRLAIGLQYLFALKMQAEVFGGCGLHEKQKETCRQGKLVCERISDLTSRDVIVLFNNIFDMYSGVNESDKKRKKKGIFSRLFA